MSEPLTLYVNAHLRRSELDRFLAAPPLPVHLDKHLESWWDHQEMYSKTRLTEIPVYEFSENCGFVQKLLDDPRYGAFEQYDEAKECWFFCVLFFSENYHDILPAVAWLYGLGPYLNEGSESLAMIYDFYWGSDDLMVLINYKSRRPEIQPDTDTKRVSPAAMAEANEYLTALAEKLNHR